MSRASIGNMLAELSLNIASFEQGIGKAASLLDSQGARMNAQLAAMEKRFERFNTAAGAFVTAWVLKMGVQAVRASAAFGESVAGMSENLGMATDEAQEFQFAIQRGGATAEQAAGLMDHFVSVVGEAADGSDSAQRSLEKLGITTDDLREKDIAGLFLQATNTLSQFSSSAQRNEAAIAGFGKAAKSNADALAISSDQMARFRSEARDSGGVMDKALVESSKQLHMELQTVERSLKITFSETMVAAGPMIIRFGELVRDAARMVKGLAQEFGLMRATTLSDQMDVLLKKRMKVSEALQALSGENHGGIMGAHTKRVEDRLRGELTGIDAEIRAINDKRAAINQAGAAPRERAAGPGGPLIETDKQRELVQRMIRDREKAEAELTDDLSRKIQLRTQMVVGEMQERMKAARLWVDDGRRGTAEQQKAMQEYYAWLKAKNAEIAREFETPIQKLAREWGNTTKQMQEAGARWLDTTADALTQFVMTGKMDFRSFSQSIIADLVRIQIQKGISSAISGAGSWFSGMFQGFFAEGGDFSAGRPMIVGENGPELIVPRASGSVMPNSDLRAVGGSVSVSVSVDARGSSVSGDGAAAQGLGTGIANAVRGVLVQELRPGGLLAG